MADWSKWDLYQDFVIDPSQVDADLTDYPVYLRGSDLDTDHRIWTEAQPGGGDIKAAKTDDTEMPVEIVTFDQPGKDFEIHTKYEGTLSSTTGGTVRLNFSNPSDAAHAESATNGREAVWNINYKAVLHLGETANNDVDGYIDSTGNANHGTGASMSSDVEGKIGNAADFVNADDLISISSHASLDLTDAFAISAWVNATTITGKNRQIISRWSESGDAGYLLFVHSGGTLRCQTGDGTSWSQGAATSSATLSTATTYHVAGRLGSGTLETFINGSADGSDTGVNDVSNTGGALELGHDVDGGNQEWDGWIDELRISDVALASTWISTEYNNQNSPGTFYSLPRAIQRHRNPVLSAA